MQGVIKPDVVFFGEDLPAKFWSFAVDFARADLLLVMGTSLEVHPFAGIVDAIPRARARLLFNRDPVGSFAGELRRQKDCSLLGDLQDGVRMWVHRFGWVGRTRWRF